MAKTEKKAKPADPNAPRASALSPEEFVKGWIGCKSNAEAETKLGVGATARAARLRRAGVKLPKYRGGRAPIDVKALNALIPASK